MLLKGHSVRIRTEKSPVDHAKWRWWFTLARTVSKFFYPQQFLWKCRLDHIRLFKTHQGLPISSALQTTVLDQWFVSSTSSQFSPGLISFNFLSIRLASLLILDKSRIAFAVQDSVCISCLLFQEWMLPDFFQTHSLASLRSLLKFLPFLRPYSTLYLNYICFRSSTIPLPNFVFSS